MAGASKALEISAAAASSEWKVEYSRFFHILPRSSSSSSLAPPLPPGLRPRKHKVSSSGIWLAASSPALLLIHRTLSDGDGLMPVLSVSLSGVVHEEHFVSNLSFSWPQVSCDSTCPTRGSRVVFMSYRDCTNLIQKFAARFRTSCVAETFLKSVQALYAKFSRETMNAELQGSDLLHEKSSSAEFVASNCLHLSNDFHRTDDESNFEEPIAICPPEIPELTYSNEQSGHAIQPFPVVNTRSIFSGFTPSFTELLTNSLADPKKVDRESQTIQMEVADQVSYNGASTLDAAVHGPATSEGESNLMNQADLKSQIVKYMSDASFLDMLTKMEKEFSRDTMDVKLPRNFMHENTSSSGFVASDGLHCRSEKELSSREPIAICAPEISKLSHKRPEHLIQSSPTTKSASGFSRFPPGFDELLTNCTADPKKEQTSQTRSMEGNTSDTSLHAANSAGQSKLMLEADLKSQIAKYMSDASFLDMLFKVEEVVEELCGGLAL